MNLLTRAGRNPAYRGRPEDQMYGFGQLLAYGTQHILTMYGGVIAPPLIVGGVVSHLELATRSSIGPYFFSPAGENERLLTAAGFSILSVTDTSSQAATIAKRWHDARERRRDQLIALENTPEDPDRFDGLQRFLACVHTLTSERRLLRHLYLAQKP